MRVYSWNVNSIRARQARVEAYLDREKPQVLCLQELKTEEASFPSEIFQKRGYHVAADFQRTYNGVAIVSMQPLTEVRTGLADDGDNTQARLVSARVDGMRVICVYVPNGGEVASDKYPYKLQWLARLRKYLDTHHSPDEPLLLCGDFNVAPDERDVHEPAAWEAEVLFHPDVRAAWRHVTEFGLKDSLRLHTQEPGIFSWWDYRMLGFPKNRGLRIDHILLTESLAKRCTAAGVDRNERKGKQPSDHAPVWVELT